MFLQNLNVFFPCFVILSLVASGPIYIVSLLLLLPFHAFLKGTEIDTYITALSYLAFAVVLVVFWFKTGLSPATRKPERERRYRIGHWLVGGTNIALLATIVGPILMANISGNSNLGLFAWFSLLPLVLGFVLWPAGLFMIWSSRA